MSKNKGILYYRGDDTELKEMSNWDKLSEDEKKELSWKVKRFGKLGWFETKSVYPPDKYWEGEIENGVPHGKGTFYTPEAYSEVEFYNGSKFEGTYENGESKEGTFTLSKGNKYVGTYRNNKKWNGEMIYADGEENTTYVNGAAIKKYDARRTLINDQSRGHFS